MSEGDKGGIRQKSSTAMEVTDKPNGSNHKRIRRPSPRRRRHNSIIERGFSMQRPSVRRNATVTTPGLSAPANSMLTRNQKLTRRSTPEAKRKVPFFLAPHP